MSEISGGEALQKALDTIARNLESASSLQVGFLDGATYPDGTSVATAAAIQNFGAPGRGIPPRPFFTNMVAEKSKEWGPALAGLLEANDMDAKKSLSILGVGIEGQLRQSIVDTNSPPLSLLTLMARKWKTDHPNDQITGSVIGYLAAQLSRGPPNVAGVSTKPLVETGNMLNSIGSEVS